MWRLPRYVAVMKGNHKKVILRENLEYYIKAGWRLV